MHRILHLILVALATTPTVAEAGKFNRQLDVGDPAPTWADLPGTDGRTHALKDHQDANLVVVAFISCQCPIVQAYEPRFKQFVDDYRDKGVVFVAVNPSIQPTDTLDKMKQWAEDRGYNFDYLSDPSQDLARAYGVTCTPQVFVLDRNRRVAYTGAFDSSKNTAQVKYHYLRDAVDALLAGGQPEVTESLQFGCAVEYRPQK